MDNDIPLLFLEIIHFRPASKHPSPAIRFGDLVSISSFVTVLQLNKLIGRHIEEQPASVVKAAQPELASVIANVNRKDVAVLGFWEGLVAAFAAPLSLFDFYDFLIAAF